MKKQKLKCKEQERKTIKKNNGITLIALVITVIVLLILAGVTIATLTGENGILTRASDAAEQTEIANVIEQAQTDILGIQAENKNGTITQEQLKGVLDKYFDGVPNDFSIDDIFTTKDEYGKHEIAVSEIYNGELKTAPSIPEGLEIGSTVSYNPNGTYTIDEKYSGSADNPDVLDSSTDEFNIDTWKVLDINTGTGEVTLVPVTSTDNAGGWVYFNGAQGYNNAVYLLNEACSNLYGDSRKGITARSINIEDIEGKMTETALTQAYNNTEYGEQVSSAYSQGYSYYPSLYAKEILSVINGTKNNTGLGRSQQTYLVEPDDEEATNGRLQASTSIQPYQTYWYGENSFMQTAFESTENGINYYNLLMPDGENTFYWVASRCVNTNSSICNFSVCHVNSGGVSAYNMFNSYGVSSSNFYYGLFPVVSLSSELIGGNATDGFSV